MDEQWPADADTTVAAIDQLSFILAVAEGPDLTVSWMNGATRALLTGRDPAGRPMRDVLGDLAGQQITDAYYEVYRTGETITGREWRVHLEMPDGSVHEMFATFTISPWRRADGGIRGVVGVGFDVTDMVRARHAAEKEAADLKERYEQSRDVITALQRELLPPAVPVLPGLQIAASYLLADAETAAGGDWYDAVVRPDGSVALVVGDVVGHGVTASGAMGQLRAVLQDRLDGGADIGEALTAADRLARRLPPAHATTVCLVVLDPADGTLRYCTAGHPAPLVVTADGGTRFLAGTGGSPLGTSAAFTVRTERLDVGDLLLLYTDGILERPGRSVPDSRAELAQVAADSAAGRALRDPGTTPAERVCTQTVELLVRTTGHRDDLTLLAAQRTAAPEGLDLTLPADPRSLRPARARIAAWLTGLGATDQDVFVLQHGLGELMTNAIEHGGGEEVRLHAALGADGHVEARITDQGRWREPARRSHRGRGLALTAQLVASMRVQPTGDGTVATVRHPLTRPAHMLTDELTVADHPAAPAAEFRVVEVAGDDERVSVEGPVDAGTADRLRQDLLYRGRGGTLPLTIDLSAVTHLASAGVSALHHVADRHAEQGGKLTVYAAPGSIAQHVLALVSIPHLTAP
jgi:serine phosphatase RsbU (regulator of sigma subunit)/anti-sigma regulatory factor (Ser/Thr protein kinase)/anti-anti-sigma regulatory factor